MKDEKMIYEWIVPKNTKNHTGYDSIENAYRIVLCDKAQGGCIVYAKRSDSESHSFAKWEPTQNTRLLIKHLCEKLGIIKSRRKDDI